MCLAGGWYPRLPDIGGPRLIAGLAYTRDPHALGSFGYSQQKSSRGFPPPAPAPSFPLQSVIVVGKNFRGQRARKGSQSSPVLQVGGPCPATAGGVRVVPLVHAQVWGWAAQAEPLVAVG